jgi:hypothetical protein
MPIQICGNRFPPFWAIQMADGNFKMWDFTSEEAAKREIERLASLNPGKQFALMKCVALCSVPPLWSYPEE